MADYDEEKRFLDSASYYGATVEKEEISSSHNKHINEYFDIRHQPTVKCSYLRVGNVVKIGYGNVVKIGYGSVGTNKFNKTLYRIDDIVEGKKNSKNGRLRYHVFAEPFSKSAKPVRFDFILQDNTGGKEPFLSSSLFSYDKLSYTEDVKQKVRTQYINGSVSFYSNKRSNPKIIIVPDVALVDFYDIEVENPAIFTLSRI